MKTTLIYKQADILMQLAALIIPAIAALLHQSNTPAEICLISLGAVQVLSCIINRRHLDPFLRSMTRTGYEVTLLLMVVATLVFGIAEVIFSLAAAATLVAVIAAEYTLCFYYFLLLFSPLMALWYLTITIHEMLTLKRMAHRRDYM